MSFGVLEALDYHSTRKAISSGAGREANPLVKPIATNGPALMAAKAVATVCVIVAGQKMWKRNRTAAVIFVAGMNGVMAVVVARNYSIARSDRRLR